MDILTEVNEGLFAAVVRALIMAAQAVIPGAEEWWKKSRWKNLVVLSLCMGAPMIMWAIECPLGWADIPAFEPRCNAEGVLLDTLYPGFLAFLINYVGEDAFDWIRRKTKNRAVFIFLSWLGSLAFWLFVAIVVVEAIISLSGMAWWLGLLVSTGIGVLLTLIGMVLQSMSLAIQSSVLMSGGQIIWWVAIGLKIIVHFLPIPSFVAFIISGTLSVIVFLLANFVFGVKRYDS